MLLLHNAASLSFLFQSNQHSSRSKPKQVEFAFQTTRPPDERTRGSYPVLGFVSKHVVASLRDAKHLRLGETQLRESSFRNKAYFLITGNKSREVLEPPW